MSLTQSIASIPTIHDSYWAAQLDAAINNKTKPIGSLGLLEQIGKQIGLIQQSITPSLQQPTIIVFAADHGVTAENISAFPQSVTWQMVENFLAQGAAINVFARQNGCALLIVDAGVNHDFGVRDGLLDRKIGPGTRNFAQEPAMTAAQCLAAMQAGQALVVGLDSNLVGFGEMGIGNTTSAAALMHKLTGFAVADCVGAGTGLSPEGIRRKQAAIETAVLRHTELDSETDPLAVLASFGGFEIAMIVGAMLAAAERRMVILIDGFIVTSALIVAAKLQPAILDYCVFSHCSNERGHQKMLTYLGARPLLQLDLRLGEGSACALVLPLVQSAVNFINEMATFSSAAVSEKTASETTPESAT